MKPCSYCKYAALCLSCGGPSTEATLRVQIAIRHAMFGDKIAITYRLAAARTEFQELRPKGCPGWPRDLK